MMTISKNLDTKLVKLLEKAEILTVEDFLGVVTTAQGYQKLEKLPEINDKLFRLTKMVKDQSMEQDKPEKIESPEPLSDEYIQARDYILKKNKELYERLS